MAERRGEGRNAAVEEVYPTCVLMPDYVHDGHNFNHYRLDDGVPTDGWVMRAREDGRAVDVNPDQP